MILQDRAAYSTLLSETAELTGVPVDDLNVYLIPPARTVFITDKNKVFVKSAISDGSQEKQGAMYATELGLQTPALLAHAKTDNYSLLVFDYIGGSIELLMDPLPLLQSMWLHPGKSDFAVADIEGRRQRAFANVESLSAPEQKANQFILDLIEELGKEASTRSKDLNLPITWIHGDCHERNLVLVDDVPTLLDFEWSGLGFRETDAAKWLQCNISESDSTNPMPFWDSLKTTDLDLEVVKLEIRQSAARAYTYQLRWRTRLDWLEGLRNLALGEDVHFKNLT